MVNLGSKGCLSTDGKTKAGIVNFSMIVLPSVSRRCYAFLAGITLSFLNLPDMNFVSGNKFTYRFAASHKRRLRRFN
jgi:hypothetical protein